VDVCEVRDLRASEEGGLHRVSAEVAGAPVWFETRDLLLAAAPEAIGSAFLIPAAASRSALHFGTPLDSLWRENAARAAAQVRAWWGYPVCPPIAPASGSASGAAFASMPAPGATALFFSGGIDSFHALLASATRIDWLVTLCGFDFPLADTARAAAAEASLRAVAEATGARGVFVRTNLREHPALRAASWDRTHGGALAAVGHLLALHATRVLIAASLPGDQDVPWGSHWRLDPLWSSSRLTVAYDGRGVNRVEKLRRFARHPLVQGHLRVCWRNRTPTGNCGECAKCLLAMFVLHTCGALEGCPVFSGSGDLVARIDRLRRTPDRIHSFEEVCDTSRLDPDLERAVRALIRRSRHEMGAFVQTRRRVAGWLLGLAGRGRP
jgi:hypothetical protein